MDLKRLFDGKNPRIESKDIDVFEGVLAELAKVCPDSNEYACLRAIVLFRTSVCEKNGGSPQELRRLHDVPAVAALQDHSQAVLNEVGCVVNCHTYLLL